MKTLILTIVMGLSLALILMGCQSVYVTSAKVYLQQNDLDNAQEQLELGLQQNSNDAQAHYLLGQIYGRKQMYHEMLTEFNASLALSDKYKGDIQGFKEAHFKDHYNAAVEHFNNSRIDRAIAELKIATLIDPSDQEGWGLLGRAYVRNQQDDEAMAALTEAVTLDPTFEKMDDHILLMEMYYNKAKYQEALNEAMQILRHEQTNAEAIKIAAFCYNQLGMPDKAIEYYQQILTVNPDDPDLIFNLGLLYEQMERFQDAVVQFKRTFELNPKDVEAILHCAQMYLEKLEDNHSAIECYKQALQIDPENPGIWNNLGIAQIRAGEKENDVKLIEEGKASIAKATELQAQNP